MFLEFKSTRTLFFCGIETASKQLGRGGGGGWYVTEQEAHRGFKLSGLLSRGR